MSEIRECSTNGCEAFACHGETKCQSCLADEHRAKQAAPRAPLTVGEAIDLLSLAARSSTWQGADPRLAKALLEVLRSETEACFRAQINRDHMRDERDEARREVELLRTKASDDWDLALRERDRAVELRNAMATDVLACLAAAGIATPVEGYVKASWAVSGDIARLARERDEARAEVERLKAEVESLKEGHVYVCSDCLEDPCECGTAQELAEAAHWLSTRAADPKPTPPVDVPDLSRAYHECNGCVDCDPAHFQPPAKTLSVPTTSEAEAEAAEARFEKLLAAKRAKHVEQPAPTGNGAEVFRVAIAECPSVSLAEVLKAREAVGIERYGTTLRTHNGRDAVRDLREELADAYVYATQAGMEAEAGEPPPDHLLRAVRWALVEAWRALEEHERRRRLEVP